MNAATRARKQDSLSVTHTWRYIFQHSTPSHRKRYYCTHCLADCSQTYASHRIGWLLPMKWFGACKTAHVSNKSS